MSKSFIPTPHNTAAKGDFAKTVLMPGDPLRAKLIAEKFMEKATLVNNVRGIHGYTGEYKGKRVSVMASGMGIPTMGIYSHELYNFYDVDNIIRIGSAGGIAPELKLKDIVIAQAACTNSNYVNQFGFNGTFAPAASYDLLEKAVTTARQLELPFKVGSVFSSDNFYGGSGVDSLVKFGILAIEMEAAGLYTNAALAHKNALTICTISDLILTGEECSALERQESFTQMIELALEIA